MKNLNKAIIESSREGHNPFTSLNINDFHRMWADFGDSPNHTGNDSRIIEDLKSDYLNSDSVLETHRKTNSSNVNKKYNYRSEDGYHIISNLITEHVEPGKENWDVEYRFNKDWFRSDHFKKEHDGLHILFGGCSNTEGVGGNIENIWSHMLYSEISKNTKTSGYYSLAKGGQGWHQIISNFKIYVKKYGAPDYLFILHPNIVRYFKWYEETTTWHYEQMQPYYRSMEDEEKHLEMHRASFPVWALSFSLFLEYCNTVGTKVLWSIWDVSEGINITNTLAFDDTFFEAGELTREFIAENESWQDDKEFLNFRDNHPGKLQQKFWYTRFLQEIKIRDWADLYDKENS